MPLQVIEREIDGTWYRLGQLPWLEGLPVFRVLTDRAGEIVVKALLTMSAEKRAELLAGKPETLVPLVTKVFGSMDAEDLNLVVSRLGKVVETKVGETEAYVCVLSIHDHFVGRYTHFLRVLYEVARHNFSGPT